MKIAIIGAGVSGLTTAYYLRKKFPKQTASIFVYDKSIKVGGNAHTMKIFLKDGTPRWVDMGVNDFNKITYKNMVALWTELGIMNDNYCKPLINEESFWPGGTSNYRYWVDDSGHVTANADSSAKDDRQLIEDQLDFFKDELVKWYKDGFKDPNIKVGAWVEGRFERKFIDNNLYPRINGMYYAQEDGAPNIPPPSLMPLWMVAHYYILQEGYAMENKNVAGARQYFVNGSTTWLEFLKNRLIADGVTITEEDQPGIPRTLGRSHLRVEQHPVGSEKFVIVDDHALLLSDVDIVIFATHAEDTINLIQFNPLTADDKAMMEALKKFNYGTNPPLAVALAHQDASFLPGGEYNRTYNIHIYDYIKGGNRWPYTITYLENMHQADPKPGPLFYTTLNSYQGNPVDIAREQITGMPARATFRHCKLDLAAMHAQKTINDIQIEKSTSKPRPFYYAGSFTIGAGLHEECIIQAQAIANKIAKPAEYVSDHIYNFEKGAKNFAPKYIMDNLQRKTK
jgi:predicted NAD/FAD-binding protein